MSNKFYDATKSPDHQEVQYRVTLVLWTISRGTFGHFSSSLSRRESLTKWNFFGAVNLQSTLAVLALSYSQCIEKEFHYYHAKLVGEQHLIFVNSIKILYSDVSGVDLVIELIE